MIKRDKMESENISELKKKWVIPKYQTYQDRTQGLKKWIAYTQDHTQQITVQPTYGRGRAKGNFEVLVFHDLPYSIKGITLKNTNTFKEGIRFAKSYINWGKEYLSYIKSSSNKRLKS